jgi:hypothetical protein
MSAQIDAARFEEIRFLKRQQWSVATYALTLLGAIFAIARVADPPLTLLEKIFGSSFVIGVAAFGISILWLLQTSLTGTRLVLDGKDAGAWFRGRPIAWSLTAIVFFSAAVVGWFLWRHQFLVGGQV